MEVRKFTSFIVLLMIVGQSTGATFNIKDFQCKICRTQYLCFLFLEPWICPYLCQAKCYKSADPGPCDAAFERWYFNKETCECEKFTYGGCEGNNNNFETEEKCKKECP